MRKTRNLAGFEDVANNNINKNDNININDNTNNNVIDEILSGKPKAKQLVGIYFDPEVAAALDRATGDKRGAKSALVNEAVRQLLQEKGLI